MDQATVDTLLLIALAVGGIIALAFAIATVAMPFLVWGTHTRMEDLEREISSLQSDINSVRTQLTGLEHQTLILGELWALLSIVDYRLEGVPWPVSDAVAKEIERLYQAKESMRRSRLAALGVNPRAEPEAAALPQPAAPGADVSPPEPAVAEPRSPSPSNTAEAVEIRRILSEALRGSEVKGTEPSAAADARVCPECGAPCPRQPPSLSALNVSDIDFCEKCGEPLPD